MNSRVSLNVDQITVQRGETITVWLNKDLPDGRCAEQVELRVRDDGTPEVFLGDNVLVIDFEAWEPI